MAVLEGVRFLMSEVTLCMPLPPDQVRKSKSENRKPEPGTHKTRDLKTETRNPEHQTREAKLETVHGDPRPEDVPPHYDEVRSIILGIRCV